MTQMIAILYKEETDKPAISKLLWKHYFFYFTIDQADHKTSVLQ